jgi:gas vesicle protein
MEGRKDEQPIEKGFSVWPYLFSAVAGIAAGTALGLLFAPESGNETRDRIGRWLKERREMRKALLAKKEQVAKALEAGKRAYRESKENEVSGAV